MNIVAAKMQTIILFKDGNIFLTILENFIHESPKQVELEMLSRIALHRYLYWKCCKRIVKSIPCVKFRSEVGSKNNNERLDDSLHQRNWNLMLIENAINESQLMIKNDCANGNKYTETIACSFPHLDDQFDKLHSTGVAESQRNKRFFLQIKCFIVMLNFYPKIEMCSNKCINILFVHFDIWLNRTYISWNNLFRFDPMYFSIYSPFIPNYIRSPWVH